MLRPHGYAAEGSPGLPGRLLGESLLRMAGSVEETLRHCLVGFWMGWSIHL